MKKDKRKLLYNVRSHEENPTEHHWSFVIVNEDREISIIKQRIRESLAPTDLEVLVTKGQIKGSGGLQYQCITLTSYKRETPDNTDWEKIYQGKIIRDEKLGSHKSQDGLQTYVDNKFS